MAYALSFDPPDLPADAGTLRHQLEDAFLLHGLQIPEPTRTSRLLLSYLLTTDKACREYSAGCGRMKYQMAHGSTQALAEALGSFENCINATKRALRLLERVANQPDGPTVDRTFRKLAQSSSSMLTDVRNSIEHIDEGIVSDEGLLPGEAHLLMIAKAGDSLEIGSNMISFVALGSTVKGLHSIGTAIVQELPRRPCAAS